MNKIVNAYVIQNMNIINNDEVLQEYEKDLNEKHDYVRGLVLNARIIDYLIHPIKLIVTKQEFKRLHNIDEEYHDLKRSSLILHFDEESGDFEEDLRSAALYFKPERLRLYTRLNPVYDEDVDKYLLKKRK